MHNRLGITTANELVRAEKATAAAMTTAILENVEPNSWKPSLLRDLHYKLFGQIYSWAGEYRTAEIGKGTSHFAAAEHVTAQVETILDALEQECQHWNPRATAVLDRLAHYYSELNAIHPFRDGNGRTIRLFLSLLANRYGWWLDWTAMTAEENV
ncbi:Fic family protein [TM7 phylum sp. oral taxon 349]|nr:Fic family protein [TM7 phylum sp. oral taxon 349]